MEKQVIEIHDNESGISISSTLFDELQNFQGSDDLGDYENIEDAKAALSELAEIEGEEASGWEIVMRDDYRIEMAR